ncbi:hypothetical protein [Patulibacter minatonensis]|uniref:hypothetical protein n=1 Tax=Patulibacter minatonensis TaxID=298163 RepID=UPI000478F076|nr:hypothetical protein [Patulibacter minatonensis]
MSSPSRLRSPQEVRRAYARALGVRAATHPAALGVLVVLLVAGFALGLPPVATIALAALVYVAAGGVLLSNGEFRDAVAKELRPSEPAGAPALPSRALAMPVAQAYGGVREHAMKLRELAGPDRLDQPEVAAEVDRLVEHLTRGAERASVLADTLDGLDVSAIRRQIGEAERGGDAELLEAYRQQLRSAERCEEQLGRYYGECRRATVEVDTIRMNLAAASSMESGEDSRQAAETLRSVREHAGALVEGMEEAYRVRPPD